MKKYMFTESQIKSIVNGVVKKNINEQVEESKQIKSIQQFLNQWRNNFLTKPKPKIVEDGTLGPETKNAIQEYQTFLIKKYKVDLVADGIWGPNTEKHMPPTHKQMLDTIKQKNGDIFDKFLNMFK